MRMSKPLIVEIPHQLGREEARRRLEAGIGQLKTKFGDKLTAVDESWAGDHLDVTIRALGQAVTAALDVENERVRLEVQLPWMLAMLAEKAKGFIRKEGQLLLEKK
jgi:putative polyhydroxyalkanoate system protein